MLGHAVIQVLFPVSGIVDAIHPAKEGVTFALGEILLIINRDGLEYGPVASKWVSH
jgi:hypothetical protein